MSLTLELIIGSDLTIDRDNLTIVRKFRVLGTLPYIGGGDAFDTVASLVMSAIQSSYPTYATPMGTLFWNSIQLHESWYAQHYEVSVTYSPFNKQTGTYMIRVEHSAGMAPSKGGELIATYPADAEPAGDSGTFHDGKEDYTEDVPFNTTRIVVSFRHPGGILNAGYIRAIGELAHYPNADTFLGYDPGEVAYDGGNFSQTDTEASAEYAFEISPNATNISYDGITITEKKGFDFICPVYTWDVGDDGGGTTKAIRKLDRVKIIRPPSRRWKDYVSVFGWGGP